MYEKKIAELIKQIEDERACSESAQEQLDLTKKLLSEHQMSIQVSTFWIEYKRNGLYVVAFFLLFRLNNFCFVLTAIFHFWRTSHVVYAFVLLNFN
jgi:hypothetical protein